MSKRTVIPPTKREADVKNRIGIAVIIALVAVIIALTVLIALDASGLLYRSDNSNEIKPPKKASAETYKDGEYSYVLLTDGTVMITNSALPRDATELSIPDTLGGYKVSAIGESAFALMTELQTVRVPEGVTYIGKAVFFGALNARLYLPSTLKQIDDGAMEGFDEPAGIYFAGTEKAWSEVVIGDGNAILARVVCEQ